MVTPTTAEIAGGRGNDEYFVQGAGVLPRETADGGVDTVYAEGSFVLPEHVERLIKVRGTDVELTGNDGPNVILAGRIMSGMGGDDALLASDAAILLGGAGNDVLTGLRGADFLDGGDGDDVLNGGAGDDVIVWSAGNDTIGGGADIDLVDYSTSPVPINVDLTKRSAVLAGEVDVVSGIENIDGTAGDDIIVMNALDNLIAPGLGSDIIDGRAGNDTIILPTAIRAEDVTVAAHRQQVEFVYDLDGVTYKVTVKRVEMVQFGDGSMQLIEQLLVPAQPMLDTP